MRRMGGDVVLSGLRSSGEEFPIDAAISHVAVEGRRFFTVILRDITQRQQAAQALARSRDELREMYDAMHQVRESERTRIARELHDELAQWLTALKLDAAWIASRLVKEHAPLASKAEDMKEIVDNTVTAMRRIAADLRPVMLDDLGLVPAIEHLLHQLSERTGIRVDLRAAGHLAIGDPLATALYRMVQEALTNVARHAEASKVRVELEAAGDRVRVSVRDDGRGLRIDPARKTFGLLGIRERARSLGGNAQIYSAKDGGTVVEIDVPAAAQANGEGRRDTRRVG
jgi:two-component system sensor kinase